MELRIQIQENLGRQTPNLEVEIAMQISVSSKSRNLSKTRDLYSSQNLYTGQKLRNQKILEDLRRSLDRKKARWETN